MVKIRWKYVAGILSAVVLIIAVGAAFWLFATTSGARWLVSELLRRTEMPVSVGQVDGSLNDTLVLKGIEARFPDVDVALEHFKLSWRPGALLRGKVLVTALEAEGLVIDDRSRPESRPREAPAEWRLPQLPGWLHRVRAEIRRFKLERLVLQRPDRQTQRLERIQGRVKWTGNRLEVSSLEAEGPPGTLSASLQVRWLDPRLRLEASARLREVAGGEGRFDLALELSPRAKKGGFTGKLQLDGAMKPTGPLQLAGDLELGPEIAALRHFQLRLAENSGRISGNLQLGLAGESPEVRADLELESVDLARMTGQATDLNGSLHLAGPLADYQGRFELVNRAKDWRAVRLTGNFAGDRQGVDLSRLSGRLLQGRIGGELTARWQPEVRVEGRLEGASLNPAAYDPAWSGDLNFEAQSRWRRTAEGSTDLVVGARLLESTLRGYGFRGRLDARLLGEELQLSALELQGEGVQMTARGALSRRIDFQLGVKNLATVLPDAAGALQGSGWVRWKNEQLAGEVRGSGRQLRFSDMVVGEAEFSAKSQSAAAGGDLRLQMQRLRFGGFDVRGADLKVSGGPEDHRLKATVRMPRETTLDLALAGGYQKQVWRGTLQQLVLQDPAGPWRLQRPVPLTLSARTLEIGELRLAGQGEEELTASADWQLRERTGRFHLQWQAVRLARINPWLEKGRISGRTSGRAVLDRPQGKGPNLSLNVQLAGRFTDESLDLNLTESRTDLVWNRQGLEGTIVANLAEDIRIQGRIHSPEPAAFSPPRQGDWELSWNNLNLRQLQSWFPAGMTATGEITGQSRGTWAPKGVLTAKGSASLVGGSLEAPVADTLLSLPLKSADLSWDWQDNRLEGRTSLNLADRGRLAGDFRLPLAARLPARIEPEGRLTGRVEGTLREQGMVAALFPGTVQETHGELNLAIDLGGTWREPELGGRLRMSGAGAFVPAAGIELEDISLEAELKKDRVDLTAFSVKSGPGRIKGTGALQLRQFRVTGYRAALEGERFEVIRLPELQARISPRLKLRGSPEKAHVEGTIEVPEFLLRELQKENVLSPSEDVIIVGEEAPSGKPAPMAVTADIEVILGDSVLIKMAGLDARLIGKLNLKMAGTDNIRANGRISVAEGDYRAYGANLEIERGNLLFSGPVEQPTLDILALRTVGEVKAGVRVTGTPRSPVVDLYSDPAMSNNDRLAYIVLGHPFARDGGEAGLLMSAAGALLSQGESVVLQDQLKRQLGVDVLEFESGGEDVTESMLTIGKYLSPDLYVSIGQSLFQETTEFRVRYSLGKHLEVESKTGTESGVDLYYKIEFR